VVGVNVIVAAGRPMVFSPSMITGEKYPTPALISQ
jgi:hypothetical protein